MVVEKSEMTPGRRWVRCPFVLYWAKRRKNDRSCVTPAITGALEAHEVHEVREVL